MARKLNQVLAIEKGVKSRVYGEVTELHKRTQKPEPFNGFSKAYRKKDEEGEEYPPERKRVELVGEDVLRQIARLQTELFDVEASKDYANCSARADVMVGDAVLLHDAPVTHLLFLEKQLVDMRTFIEKLPVLDEGEEWTLDPNSGLYRTEPTTSHRTKKAPRVIVKFPATKEHPAQTELFTEDIIVGWWDTIKHSGALPAPRKQALLERVDTLLKAVKVAREKANDVDCPEVAVGKAIFDYLFTLEGS